MEKWMLILLCLSLPVEAAVYYVDPAGSDTNGGTSETSAWKTLSKVNSASLVSGDSVLFKRGGEWRGSLSPKSGSASGYITYGAYGAGNKPRIMNSVEKMAASDWSSIGSNRWRTSIPGEPGIVVFNDGATIGERKWSEGEASYQGAWYWGGGSVTIYSAGNPAQYYSDIEISQAGHIVNGGSRSYYILENIELRYGAHHGWQGSGGAHHVIIRDCDISYIGGGVVSGAGRLGNAIELWNAGHDLTFERNRIWEVYDAALTNQGNSQSEQYNIYYRNNIIWNAEYCFEYWLRPSSSQMHDIYFENNICAYSGYGFGHKQRGDPHGWHVIGWGQESQASNFYIRNNIFYESTACGFETWDPDWSYLTPSTLDNNIYYESDGYVFCTVSADYTMSTFSQYQSKWGTDKHSTAIDPRFASPSTLDFHPTSASPGIDKAVDVGLKTDFEGNARPAGLGFDIGAFEFGGTSVTGCIQKGYHCCPAASVCSQPASGTGCIGTCCASSATCAAPRSCGNSVCDPAECNTCPNDCTSTQCCGDGSCNKGETCLTCLNDCLSQGQVCCNSQAISGNCCSDTDCVQGKCISNRCQVNTDLVLHLKFDENLGTVAYDSSLVKNDATLSNAQWTQGKTGSAMSVSGSGYAQVPDSLSLDITEAITITAYVYPTDIRAWSRIVSKSHSQESNPWNMYGLFLTDSSRLRFEYASGSAQNNLDTQTPISAGNWYFVAATYDGSRISMYIDGNLDASAQKSGRIDANHMPLSIGRSGYGTDYFHGVIDELRIYNRALSQQELKALMKHQADADGDGCIRQDELMQYISKWKNGQVTLASLMEAIGKWKNGC